MLAYKKSRSQLHLNSIVFLMCLKAFLVLTIDGFSSSMVNSIFAILILILVITRFINKYKHISYYKAVGFCILAALLVVSSIRIKSLSGALPLLLFFIVDRDELNDTIKCMFYTELFLMILIIPITIVKYSNGYCLYTSGGTNDFIAKRYRLAFSHPNVLGGYFFNLVIMWVWINYEKIKKYHLLIIMLLNGLVFLLTGSKTVFFVLIVFIILILVFHKKNKISRVLKYTAAVIFPTLLTCTYFLLKGMIEGNVISLLFNQLLSNRIKVGAYSLSKYGISLWGQYIELGIRDHSNENFLIDSLTFDNLYAYILINIGLVFAIIISIAIFILAMNGNNKIYIFIIVWALYGISEIQGLYILRCFPLLLLTLLIKPKKKKANVPCSQIRIGALNNYNGDT